LKEVFRQCSTGAVEEAESVEKADTRWPELPAGRHRKGDVTTWEECREGRNFLSAFFWQGYCLNSPEANGVSGRHGQVHLRFAAKGIAKGLRYGIRRLRLYAESCGTEPGLLPEMEEGFAIGEEELQVAYLRGINGGVVDFGYATSIECVPDSAGG